MCQCLTGFELPDGPPSPAPYGYTTAHGSATFHARLILTLGAKEIENLWDFRLEKATGATRIFRCLTQEVGILRATNGPHATFRVVILRNDCVTSVSRREHK